MGGGGIWGGVRCGAEEPFDRQAGLWIASNTDSRPLSRLPVLSLSLSVLLSGYLIPQRKGQKRMRKMGEDEGSSNRDSVKYPPAPDEPLPVRIYLRTSVLSIVLGEQRVDTPTSS